MINGVLKYGRLLNFFVITGQNEKPDDSSICLAEITVCRQVHDSPNELFRYNILLSKRRWVTYFIKMENIKQKCIFFHSTAFPRFQGQKIYMVTKLLNHICDPQLAGILSCNNGNVPEGNELSYKSHSQTEDTM